MRFITFLLSLLISLTLFFSEGVTHHKVKSFYIFRKCFSHFDFSLFASCRPEVSHATTTRASKESKRWWWRREDINRYASKATLQGSFLFSALHVPLPFKSSFIESMSWLLLWMRRFKSRRARRWEANLNCCWLHHKPSAGFGIINFRKSYRKVGKSLKAVIFLINVPSAENLIKSSP